MSTEHMRRTLENRILAAMKLDPSLTYERALGRVLQTMGLLLKESSITVDGDLNSSRTGQAEHYNRRPLK